MISKSLCNAVNGEDFLNVESLQYDLKVLQIATNMFSDENKLGEGGFGGVYKVMQKFHTSSVHKYFV